MAFRSCNGRNGMFEIGLISSFQKFLDATFKVYLTFQEIEDFVGHFLHKLHDVRCDQNGLALGFFILDQSL